MYFLGPVSPQQKVQAVPGGGTNVPIWLLGSSTFSAHLAANLGLPFAFAGQFAPQMLFDAITIYREYFKPSDVLEKPHLMIGLPVLAADADEQAEPSGDFRASKNFAIGSRPTDFHTATRCQHGRTLESCRKTGRGRASGSGGDWRAKNG